MASPFKITQHIVNGQHMREYPGGVADEQQALKIAVKQYTPLDNLTPAEDDVTIILATSNGFAKEVYEPFFEQLRAEYLTYGQKFRNIWVADMAQTAYSGMLNESNLGNDPSISDHGRDLLAVINHFRDEMRQPIIGIGHSAGANQLCFMAHFHPRLFSALVLVEISASANQPTNPIFHENVRIASKKKELWPSKAAVATSVAKSPFFKTWDPRVIPKLLEYNYRSTPTLLFPQENMVTLTTTKHQETYINGRANFANIGADASTTLTPEQRFAFPDVDPDQNGVTPWYRPESRATFLRLRDLRPGVLFVQGQQSTFGHSGTDRQAARMQITGTGPGGSGGVAAGRVKEVYLEGSHFPLMENVNGSAASIAGYIAKEAERWRGLEGKWLKAWRKKSVLERQTLGDEWMATVAETQRKPRRGVDKNVSKI